MKQTFSSVSVRRASIVQSVFSVAETDDAALEQAREWKGTMVDEHYTDPIADPATIYRKGEDEVSDSTFTKQIVASADPDTHVKRIRMMQKLGATTIVPSPLTSGVSGRTWLQVTPRSSV